MFQLYYVMLYYIILNIISCAGRQIRELRPAAREGRPRPHGRAYYLIYYSIIITTHYTMI